ncbi:bifunctional 5,10-methylenetetrahydrofolate dehydrogenase/5,10-methenyltetrahydrofolate cyclohydrolase [Mycoplasmopsis arginini]|uniref:bifunctional 5,10-methylenetetrahydrofolate dehydrogenase/5,10-methenyltetrahydrofolate cyclohydrolase n=1 Tax=Mycoplasmopsis arginini TaxID=2094 RepID=UPI0002D15EA4|nr:bifunctional 5,10-methylenetetrahydrofolate dehydrogenase/5,10-methenyltetrahydrofolate cyclohydrolase [Mycoplasmopsis arginini]SGA02803.1 bifunctional 5,10-methylene-tetrahydrofolate dehydrogenase/ 5,10-methylene-tetrahydrofolate cyclohydrolase [Chlamydia abortus]ENY70052.1 Methylenetetrahydrofolate dehydrogenase [Mycoplasmopsis arginini 7264]MDI3348248.1 bifunctional 5,10-methylenetetrahydrofolate dehydrogenase/5,10-methenyltetrahydrofolate cyclohydrolase [Mycoplasmopsis arginini]PWC09065.
MYKLLDGRKTKEEIQEKIKNELKTLADSQLPILGILQVGNLEESNIYIKHKLNIAHSLGLKTNFIKLEENATEKTIKEAIKKLNEETTGFIIQLPIQTNNVKNINDLLNEIKVEKDIDGLNEVNQKSNFVLNKKSFLPATALGIIILLKKYNIDFESMNIGVVGQSKIVGKPLSDFFEQSNARVRRYDINTSKDDIYKNDLIVVSTGSRGCLNDVKLKDNVILVDVGIHRIENKIVGDIEVDKIKESVSYLTPVPGGVGPMTIVGLILNLIKAFDIQNGTNIFSKIINEF